MSDDLEGQVLASQFKVLKKLGSGGMGAVYLAEQMEMDRKVVVKVLHPEVLAMNSVAIERFRREAKAVAQLNHPNIVQVFVFGQAESGQLYLAMEFIEGRDLAHDLSQGAMPQPRALKIIDQICAALVEAHGAGIVHRDLKPENVMLADRHGNPDYVKVLDFGIAKLHDTSGGGSQPSITQAGTVFGTPRYMSPEQVKGEPVDARSDIYALGLLLHELLTGRHPFNATTTIDYLMKHVSEPVPPPREAYSELEITPRVEAIIMRCLEKDPADRYQSVAEMQRDVRTALRDFSEAVRGYPSAPPEPAAPARSKATKGAKVGRTETHVPDPARLARLPRARPLHPAVWVVLALIVVGGIVALVAIMKNPATPSGEPQLVQAATHATDQPPTERPPTHANDPEEPDEVEPDEHEEPTTKPPEHPDEPAPTTTVEAGPPVDGFPVPKLVKPTATTAAAEVYDSELSARELIGFYKAQLHGKYALRDIPNGIQIDDANAPFSYVTISAGTGPGMMLVLTRNVMVEREDKGPDPAFGVLFPEGSTMVVKSPQAVVVRSKRAFKDVCDFYATHPSFGGHKDVTLSRQDEGSQLYCIMVPDGQDGSKDLTWQAISVIPDPTAEGMIMISVTPKMSY